MDPLSMMLMGSSALGSLGGAAINFGSQQMTNQKQMQLAQQQEQFQEQMSSTAYQRSVADMKAAGLNPMMMFGSGGAASSPGGAMASLQAPKVDIDRAVSSATQAAVAGKQVDQLVQQVASMKTEQDLTRARTGLTTQSTETEKQETFKRASEAASAGYDVEPHKQKAIAAKNVGDIPKAVRAPFEQGAYLGSKASDIISPVTNALHGASSAKRLFEERWP